MGRDIYVDECIVLLQEVREKEGNLKVGEVTDCTNYLNEMEKINPILGRWKYKEVLRYRFQVITSELTMKEEGDADG